ncbi:hypothetical protein GCM10010841_07740 [Deinococcus aerophilus]|uniref:Yip1 domain-containing protein n=2 Tax=Deinococcus aerophilus TaxID=522488 RepID=A0ABQ2GL30_9DEIO|nr:hypothetical protein GCM10010841_07740 [Deinococcus aerophilus]
MAVCMARTRPPAPPPEAPLPTELLLSPRTFARKLGGTELLWWRYLGVVAVAGLLGGVAYALLVRHAAVFAAAASGSSAPTLATHLVNTLGTTFLTVLIFVLMWGLGRVGAGLAGRAAEVYAASFALMPPLYLLVIIWGLLTPAAAFLPDATVTGSLTGDPRTLERAALAQTAQTSAGFLLVVVTLLGTAAQFGFVYAAMRELTGQTGRAVLGTLLPGLPALAVQLIAVSPLVFAR